MRVETRLLLLKLAAAIVPIALIVLAMHFLLPGLAERRERTLLGQRYVLEETARLKIWRPRGAPVAPLVARGIEAFLAAFYADFAGPFALQPLEEHTSLTVYVFASHQDLVDYARRRMRQDLSQAEGFYDPASWSIAITVRPLHEFLAVLFHEATHLILDRSAAPEPGWSLWLSEGLAVYFENSTIVGGRIRLGGVPVRDAADVLERARSGGLVPLDRLVRGGPELFRSDFGPLAYREAGLLVAFLLQGEGGKYREAFVRYYRLERQTGPVPQGAFEQVLGTPMERLQREWLAYLQRAL